MTQPPDYRQRQQALQADASFAVSAPAGSGKTGLLTQRVLTLLPLCEHPEEVVCITFTRKAAAEMKQRISAAIELAASSKRPEDPHQQRTWDLAHKVLQCDREKNWQLLQSPQRLRVHTIDGLCRSLTLMNPLSSTIGGSTRMLDNPRRAYRQAAEQALQALEQEGPLQADIGQLFLHFDNNKDRILDLLVKLLENRDQWLQPLYASRDGAARSYFEGVLAELIEESLAELGELLLPWASDLCLLADYAASNCQRDAPHLAVAQLAGICELPGTEPAALPLWRALADLLLTADGNWRKQRGLTVKSGFPAGTDKASKALARDKKEAMGALLETFSAEPGLLSLLRLVRYLPPARYQPHQWRLLDSLTRILPWCVSQLKLVFRKLNATDYGEITQGALLALGDEEQPTELGLALDYQISHILVDEFQDTSSTQWRLLERLTAGWQPGDGRTLFIVGDGMQSCYGFRNANVGLFLDARQTGIGATPLTPIDLQVNFRSQAGVVDWVNRAFRQAFPDREDISRGAVAYSESIPFKQALPGDAVHIHAFLDAEDRRAEADQVVQLVQQALAQSNGEGAAGGDGNDGSRIAILVRNRGLLRSIIPALHGAGIRWRATDIDPLASRMTIVDLISLTRALTDASDRNAWLALLRAPWIGLDNADLLILANQHADYPKNPVTDPDGGKKRQRPVILRNLQQLQTLTGLSPEGRALLQRSAPLLCLAWRERQRKSLRHLVEGLWVALGGPAALLDANDLENANDFFRLLEQFDEGGQIASWEDFQHAVDQLYARPLSGDDIQVEVMTIHKSKGLEFETVIMPGLDQGSRSDDKALLLWQERINNSHQKRLLLSPLSAIGEDTDPLYEYLREEVKLKSELESTRLFYVGCTRAINRLHLLGNLKSDSKSGQPKPPPSGSLLASIWSAVEDQVQLYPAAPDTATTSLPAANEGIIRRLPPAWQRPALVPSSLLAAYRGSEYDDDDNQVADDQFRHRGQRYIGLVLHRTLARIASDGSHHWDDARIQRQQPFWRVQLQQLGLNGTELDSAADQVELGVRRTLADSRGRWLLDNRHQHSAVESSYWALAGQPRNSIVDRTFVADGVRWVIDYKSSSPAPEQPLADFVSAEVGSYRAQMQRYRQLFSDSAALPVRAALYFPLLGHFQELD
ncbi:MAG: UvrD-helicase domain-containing protein [Gammaproteobacteria bacterium]|nr:UvrD-helicase domain-containing protein [Gammaproteobacteria bacterium]